MEGRCLDRQLQLSALSLITKLSCCVSFVRPEMQPFFEDHSSNICENMFRNVTTDFSVQVKLAQISGIALKILLVTKGMLQVKQAAKCILKDGVL